MIMLAELVAAVVLAAPASAQQTVVAEDLSVEARPGVTLAVRNKRPAGVERFDARRVVVMVHGATYPSDTFDVPLGGMSWMDYIAQRGYDVYLVHLRRLRWFHPPTRDGKTSGRKSTNRPNGCSSQRYRGGG